jgi:outer membrane autotransporter protein
MKRIAFSRKIILRAIHVACVALLLAAATAARAQTATGDGHGNVTISSGVGVTPFSFGPSSTPPLSSSGTLTLSPGVSIGVTGTSSSTTYVIEVGSAATISNSGNLSATNTNSSGGPVATLDILPVTTSGNVTINNTSMGAIEASSQAGNAIGIDVQNVEQGSISITNSNYIGGQPSMGGPAGTGSGIYAKDSYAQGSISLTNSQNIEVNGNYATGYGAQLTTSGSGGITVTNSGNINLHIFASGGTATSGLDLTSTGSGAITVNNTSTGAITGSSTYASGYGVNASASGSGAVSITNAGTINGGNTINSLHGTAINVNAAGSGTVTVANSGTLSGYSNLFSGDGAGVAVSDSGSSAVTVTNSGQVMASAHGGTASGLYVNDTGTGNISITNSSTGTISPTSSSGVANGIQAIGSGSDTMTISNVGSIMPTSSNGAANGINATTQNGTLSITNTGTITGSAYNQENGITATGAGTGSITIINSTTGAITSTSINNAANGILVSGSNSNVVTISNSAPLFVTATTAASGIYANMAAGSTKVTNSGAITLGGGGGGDGIGVLGTGQITITNSAGGTISAPNQGGGEAIYANSSGGTAQVTNAAAITLGAAVGTGFGINVAGTSASITNSGAISISAAGNGNTYGITGASTSGPLTIHNSGSLTSSTSGIYESYGIFLYNAGTVINSGNITAGTAAIAVPSGSNVTLAGRPVISGVISGGGDASSTSNLTFALTIPAANLAAAKAQLDAEIAMYNAQNGGDMTFTVDGLTFDISDFDYSHITDDLATAIARLYARTPGFAREGTVLDHLNTNNAQASKLLTALGNVSDPGLVNALSELSPKTLEIFSNVANNGATFNAAKINNHLANQRDGLTGFDATALNVQDSSMDPTLNQVRDHLLAYNPVATPGLLSDSVESVLGGTDMKSAQVNTMPTDRWSTFIAGDVILADLSHNSNLQDADYTTGDVTAGADYRLDDHFTVGALFAYSHTDASLDRRGSSATVDSYSPGIYASYVDKGWYGNGLATYGRNAYTSDRVIDIPGLQGDNHGGTSGNQGTLNLTGGYEFQKGAFKFGPVASVQYVHLSVDSMQEQGPTALTIASQDQDSFRSQLGVEGRFNANIATPIGPVSLTPHVSLSWQHEYLDDSRGINAQFTGTGGGSFATQTDSPDRDAAFIDVGLDANIGANVTLFVDYETQAGQQNFFAQSAQGGVKIGF